MKRKTQKGPIPALRTDATDEDIVRWTRAHGVFERLDKGVSEVVEDHRDLDRLLEEALVQENTTQLQVRIPPAMKAVLHRLARQRTTDVPTLARIWLAERLRQELRRGASAAPPTRRVG